MQTSNHLCRQPRTFSELVRNTINCCDAPENTLDYLARSARAIFQKTDNSHKIAHIQKRYFLAFWRTPKIKGQTVCENNQQLGVILPYCCDDIVSHTPTFSLQFELALHGLNLAYNLSGVSSRSRCRAFINLKRYRTCTKSCIENPTPRVVPIGHAFMCVFNRSIPIRQTNIQPTINNQQPTTNQQPHSHIAT